MSATAALVVALSVAAGDAAAAATSDGRQRGSDGSTRVEASGRGDVAPAADRKRRRARPKPKPRPSGPVTVPIDVGFGPQALIPTGAAFWDQPVHSAFMLSLAAVIDRDLIRRERDRVPKEWRSQVGAIGEARIRPLWLAFIPEVIVVSPAWLNTGMYGAMWRPFSIGLTFLDEPAVNVGAHAAVDLAYVFIHSQAIPEPTHFLRPGLNLDLVAEFKITDTFLVSSGWSSTFFPPQPIGRPPWEFWPLDGSLWHLGGPFLKLHVRIPYEVAL